MIWPGGIWERGMVVLTAKGERGTILDARADGASVAADYPGAWVRLELPYRQIVFTGRHELKGRSPWRRASKTRKAASGTRRSPA